MTDEQINALAREYAKATTPYDKDDFYYEAAFRNRERAFCKAIKWLSNRFCIVEKSEIKEWVNTVPEVVSFPENVALKIGAERLFGKELFKEEEQ